MVLSDAVYEVQTKRPGDISLNSDAHTWQSNHFEGADDWYGPCGTLDRRLRQPQQKKGNGKWKSR
jgi:hypothetical protein